MIVNVKFAYKFWKVGLNNMRSFGEDTKNLTLTCNNNYHSNDIFNRSSTATQLKESSNDIYKMQQHSTATANAATATIAGGGGGTGGGKQKKSQQSQQLNNNPGSTITLPKASHANTAEEIAGGVQDTIYLCNFRVSVDGEWLCLKELQDLDINQKHIGSSMATNSAGGRGNYHTQQQRYTIQKNKRFSSLNAADGLEDNNGILTIQNLFGRHLNEGQENAYSTKSQHMLTRQATNSERSIVDQFGLGLGGGGGGGDWANLCRLLVLT